MNGTRKHDREEYEKQTWTTFGNIVLHKDTKVPDLYTETVIKRNHQFEKEKDGGHYLQKNCKLPTLVPSHGH